MNRLAARPPLRVPTAPFPASIAAPPPAPPAARAVANFIAAADAEAALAVSKAAAYNHTAWSIPQASLAPQRLQRLREAQRRAAREEDVLVATALADARDAAADLRASFFLEQNRGNLLRDCAQAELLDVAVFDVVRSRVGAEFARVLASSSDATEKHLEAISCCASAINAADAALDAQLALSRGVALQEGVDWARARLKARALILADARAVALQPSAALQSATEEEDVFDPFLSADVAALLSGTHRGAAQAR